MAAKRKKSDMTYAQQVTADNDKFRNELRAQHLNEYQQLERSDDITKFRKEQYREALRDAKASR